MKKNADYLLLIFGAIVLICVLASSCTIQKKYGCDYKGRTTPKFTADIQVQGRLDSVLYHVPGRALLQMYVPKMDTTVYVYYGYFRGLNRQRFEKHSKWSIQFDSRDSGTIKRSIVKLNK